MGYSLDLQPTDPITCDPNFQQDIQVPTLKSWESKGAHPPQCRP